MRRAKKSYREITSVLGISKGTLSGWFNGQQWSAAIRQELAAATQPKHLAQITAMSRARAEKFAALRLGARGDARRRFPELIHNPLFIAGIALYWGEGDKNYARGKVRVPNVDSRLLRVFVDFLTRCCGVDRSTIYAWILFYPDLDAAQCLRYWSRVLCIPEQQFKKPITIVGRSKRRKLAHGVCTIAVNSRLLAEQIDEWTICMDEALRSS